MSQSAVTLAAVMPVYNEGASVTRAIEEWISCSAPLGVDTLLIVLNDGSTDDTADHLQAYANHPSVRLVNKQNEGHGPTIHRGYQLACELADWVFQFDSDLEIPLDQITAFWEKRNEVEGIFGNRVGRSQTIARRILTTVSHAMVKRPGGIADANCPFRLLKASVLSQCLEKIPATTFAPNILISDYFSRHAHALNIDVCMKPRISGTSKLSDWRILSKGVRCARETIVYQVRDRFSKTTR